MLSNGVPFVFVRELMGIRLTGTLVGAGVPVLVSGPSLVKDARLGSLDSLTQTALK
jgi:hypothetical protein